MFHAVLILAVPVAVLWAFVVFPSFRIVVGLIAVLGFGLFYFVQKGSEIHQQEAKAESLRDEAAKKAQIEKIERLDTERWALVQPGETQIRDITLTSKINGLDTHAIAASVRNNSKMRLTAIEADVSVYDCQAQIRPLPNGKQDKGVAAEKCETVGQTHAVFEVSIPPGQTRGVQGGIALRNLPKFQGRATYKFNVTRVKANSPDSTEVDDLLEKYGLTVDTPVAAPSNGK
jgi:uncharacterized protein (UPF0335 family)